MNPMPPSAGGLCGRIGARAAIALPALLSLASAGAAPAAAAPPQGEPATLRLIAFDTGPGTGQTNIDNGRPRHLDVGDGFTETNVLRAAGRPAGRLELTCTILKIVGGDPVTMHCSGLFHLAGGQVAIFGSLAGPRATYPVIGGTGRYSGARGEVRMRLVDAHRTEWLVRTSS